MEMVILWGEDVLRVTYLQLTDDTMIVDKKSRSNITIFKSIFLLFELIADLKVNFHKSLLVGVNVDNSWLTNATNVLNCKIDYLPFT